MTSSERITKSSLWLVPPKDSALSKSLATLINQALPPLFPETLPTQFAPHITLTADSILTDLTNPQQWLDQLRLPDLSGLKVTIGELHVGSIFFQKLIQLCEKSEALCELAATCWRVGTGQGEGDVREWIDRDYRPHLSLMYSDLSREDVISRLDKVQDLIRRTKDDSGMDCFTANGGSIWLVPTFKDVVDWSPIAERQLNAGVEWSWKT